MSSSAIGIGLKYPSRLPKYKGKGKSTQQTIKRLTAVARCVIKKHEGSKNVEPLCRNGPSHVFNDHSKYSTSFCKVVAEVTQCATPSSPTPSSSSDNSFIESALQGMIAQEIIRENNARG